MSEQIERLKDRSVEKKMKEEVPGEVGNDFINGIVTQ